MFRSDSRYYHLQQATYETRDGREIAYVRRRFLPRGDRLDTLVEVTVAEGDRLDLIAARTLGNSEHSWRICDAQDAMNPEELTDEANRVLRVPIPTVER